MHMKTDSLAILPVLFSDLTELPRIAYNNGRPRQKTDVIRLPLSTPPDEKEIEELNRLAAKHPFCIRYKVKKHDTL